MDRFENQRWTAPEVARLISIFESERRFYEEALTTLPLPLATVNGDGAVLSCNQAFQRGFQVRRDELERKSLSAIFGDTPWHAALQRYERSSVNFGAYEAVFTPVPRWDRGDTEWVVVFLARPEPEAQSPPAPSVPEPDFIANTAAVEAAQRLAGRVTHEANNLVMIASGYGHELLAQLPADSPLREDVSMLLGATQRIEAMAEQLSEYSRNGRHELAPHSLRDLLPTTGYSLPPGGTEVTVLTDRAALTAVFAALPLIATEPLQLHTLLTAQEAVITVKGFGMSAESLRQQFEVLNRAAREGKPGAREMALAGPRLLHAGVRWRVIEPGVLELHLGLAAKTAPSDARSALVVDDQAGIRTIVRRILESRGFSVTAAGSGEEALSLLDRRRVPFDLLVTDMRMTGMTGRDLADRVRFRHPSSRILFMSGFTDDPGVQSGILPERARFLSKPFHPDQLVDAVSKLME